MEKTVRANEDNDLKYRRLVTGHQKKEYTTSVPLKEGQLINESVEEEKVEYFTE